MSADEFVATVLGLGIRLEPYPSPSHVEVQYRCPDDPNPERRSSVTLREGQILAELADGKRVLEIGTGLGVSTACLASTAREVVTVDPDDWTRSVLVLPENVTRLESIEDTYGAFDLAFVDGLHYYESVKTDIVECIKRVGPGGEIVFHDMSQHDVSRAVNEFPWALTKWHDTVGHLTACVVPQ